jgi:ABC-type multidrug transport system permease subunit
VLIVPYPLILADQGAILLARYSFHLQRGKRKSVGIQLKPWLIAAVVWIAVSLLIIVEYLKAGDTKYLWQLWFLLSLLWSEFGFAAIFNSLIKRKRYQLFPLLLVTVVPPSIFLAAIYLLVWTLLE